MGVVEYARSGGIKGSTHEAIAHITRGYANLDILVTILASGHVRFELLLPRGGEA